MKTILHYLICLCLLVTYPGGVGKSPTALAQNTSSQSGTATSPAASPQEEEEEEDEPTTPSSPSAAGSGTPSTTTSMPPSAAVRKLDQASRTAEPRDSSKMRKLSFPEGKFSISLPGNPEMEYKQVPVARTNLSLRAVSYTYKEPTGNFNVAYMIFPNQVNLRRPDLANSILDSIANSFAKHLPSSPGTECSVVSQKSFPMLGCPGRELMIKGKQGGAEMFSLVRMFISGQYLYILAPEGKRAWLESPAVATFMSSMTLATAQTSGSRFGGSHSADVHQNQSDFQKKFDADRRAFNEKFSRSKDNFRRDSNALKTRAEQNRF